MVERSQSMATRSEETSTFKQNGHILKKILELSRLGGVGNSTWKVASMNEWKSGNSNDYLTLVSLVSLVSLVVTLVTHEPEMAPRHKTIGTLFKG